MTSWKPLPLPLDIDGIPVVQEGALIDPYFERGSFLVRAPLGRRSVYRDQLREWARTAKPEPLSVSVTTFWNDERFFYVLVL